MGLNMVNVNSQLFHTFIYKTPDVSWTHICTKCGSNLQQKKMLLCLCRSHKLLYAVWSFYLFIFTIFK